MDADSIQDLFQDFGPVRTRRMFGGQGIYRGETMFALEADGELYLKVDDRSRPLFEAVGSRPFVFAYKDGSSATMSYWRLPEEALEDPAEAARWAWLAMEASVRSSAKAKPRKRKAG